MSIGDKSFSDSDFIQLCEYLSKTASVKQIDLENKSLTSKSIEAANKFLINSTIEVFNLTS